MRNLLLILLGLSSICDAAPLTLPVLSDSDVRVKTGKAVLALQGPFVSLQVHAEVSNPHPTREIEARLAMTLPPEQRLRGYALDVQGELRDAVVVERVQARAAFENIVRRRVDPALVEQRPGNQYSVRVYPVRPLGSRQLRLDLTALAEPAACGWRTELSPELLQALGPDGLTVSSRQAPIVTGLRLRRKPSAPDTWQLAATRTGHAAASICLRATHPAQHWQARSADTDLRFVSFRPPAGPSSPRAMPARIELVWDNSFSQQGRRLQQELALIEAYFQSSPGQRGTRPIEVTLTVLGGERPERQVFLVQDGNTQALRDHLATLVPDGATRLNDWQPAAGTEQVLLFSDAVNTWPGQRPADQDMAVPVQVISAVPAVDPATIRQLTRAGGQWINLVTTPVADALRQLRQPPVTWRLPASFPAQAAGEGWHAGRVAAQGGELQACALGSQPARLHWTDAHGSVRDLPDTRPAPALSPAIARDLAFWCATWAADSLAASQPDQTRRLTDFALRHGVTTRDTALLVLETLDDHIRYGIIPAQATPGEIAQINAARVQREQQQADKQRQHQEKLAQAWNARKTWWATTYPKDRFVPPPVTQNDDSPSWLRRLLHGLTPRSTALREARVTAPAPIPIAAPTAVADGRPRESASAPREDIGLNLMPDAITLDSYDPRFAQADTPAAVLAIYRDVRDQHARSPGFFLRVADRLYALNDPISAARVLSTLVEQVPGEHSLLRVVAFRLLQADPTSADALNLLREIARLAPDQPTSHRDLALALAEQGQCDAAARTLAQVVNMTGVERFGDISVIALAELNALPATCPLKEPLPVPDALRADLPVDLRVVLTWNLKDTDLDLHVIDPHGEKVYFAHQTSHQGGHLSRDSTAGNGPEEFILRNPVPGEYRVKVNFYGSRENRLLREATVKVVFQRQFGTAKMKTDAQVVTLKPGQGEQLVGLFTLTKE